MAKGDDIEERLVEFAISIIDMTDKLPNTRAGNHLAGQLLRSGTSPAANYAEARGAESQKDFIHKLRICAKELNESRVWLNIIGRAKLGPRDDVVNVYRECDELCRIINSSVKTAKSKL
ncbi:MAG: four helix bundle protein [Chloroflexi bacterium]|nr:MAG: four helix bundle protein [Chloroflexota bacterium]PIE81210.1 MAG: four helix bundle protein [Chloroflexota bacterium]